MVMAGPRNNRPGADPLKNSLNTCVTVRANTHTLHKPACREVLTRPGALGLWLRQAANRPEHSPLSPTSSHRPTPVHPTLMSTALRAREGPGTGEERVRVTHPYNFPSFSLHHPEYPPTPKLRTQFLAGEKTVNLALTTTVPAEEACSSGKTFFPTKLYNVRERKEVKMLDKL